MEALKPSNPGYLDLTPSSFKPLLVAVALSVGAVAAAALFHQAPPHAPDRAGGITTDKAGISLASNAAQWKAIRLGTAKAAGEAWSAPYPARFRVNEASAARVGAPLSGRVSRVYVELGDEVKAGDKLFSVASPDVAAFRAEQRRAALDLDVAKVAHDRVVAMVNARALPGKQETEADAQVRESQLALELANSRLASLRVPQSGGGDFTVVAPRAGVIVKKSVLPSQQVDADEVLVDIADLGTVWAVADVFEGDASRLQQNGSVLVTSPLVPGLSAEAKIESVASVVDPERHTVSVRAVIPNESQALRPNTYIEMSFREPAAAGAVEIAASALVSSGTDRYVYLQEGAGHFVRRPVQAGWSHANRVVVTSGLAPGDVVVDEGGALLDNQIALDN